MNRDGLEQFPTEALDREPLWDSTVGWEMGGGEGLESVSRSEPKLPYDTVIIRALGTTFLSGYHRVVLYGL